MIGSSPMKPNRTVAFIEPSREVAVIVYKVPFTAVARSVLDSVRVAVLSLPIAVVSLKAVPSIVLVQIMEVGIG